MGSIRVVRGGELTAGPATQGMTRKAADVDERVSIAEGNIAPQTMSDWHHHGEHTTCVYVRYGQVRVEWGPGSRESADVAAGDFFIQSPNTIHRESNPGADDLTLVAFQVSSGRQVVNVDGPEPEEASPSSA